MSSLSSQSEEMIRAARERFNAAIEGKDVEEIRSLLMSSYHLVTGRSAQYHGAEEEAARWSEVFNIDPIAVYRRTPREITVNEAWGLAEELGNWRGSYTVDGTLIKASGVYAAKWQRAEDGDWLLQVEVFTTLACNGPGTGCVPPDLILR